MQEVWKSLNGIVENGVNYDVSNLGNIRNANSGKVLSPFTNHIGYRGIGLYLNGKSKKYLVHRLVAQAFIPNPDNKPEVNHLDGNKANAKLDNLEWATPSENQKHALATKLYVATALKGEEAPSAKLTEEKVLKIRELYPTGKYSYRELGEMFGVSKKAVINVVLRRNWKHVG